MITSLHVRYEIHNEVSTQNFHKISFFFTFSYSLSMGVLLSIKRIVNVNLPSINKLACPIYTGTINRLACPIYNGTISIFVCSSMN